MNLGLPAPTSNPNGVAAKPAVYEQGPDQLRKRGVVNA